MRWLVLVMLVAGMLLSISVRHAYAQSQPPPCTPPPGTSNLITCFGNTPCPSGYLDPVGLRERNIRQNFADPNGTRWLCIQDPSQSESSDADASDQGTADTANPAPSSSSAAAPASPPVAVAPAITTTIGLDASSPLGPFLTDNQGMTLYIRTNDSPGQSSCNNACAIIWPPVAPPSGDATLPDGASGTLATLTRTDGTLQLSYNGMPLYRYTGDFQPGDTNGQGLDATTTQGDSGTWKVATP